MAVPLTKQVYRGWKQQLFAGLRMADQLVSDPTTGAPAATRLRAISLADLPNQKDLSGGAVVDLSF